MAVISEYTPMYLTSKGLHLEAKVKAGLTDLKLIKAVIGEGYLQEGTDLLSLERLVSEVPSHQTGVQAESATVDFDRQYVAGEGITMIGVRIVNGNMEFNLREIGIIAMDPDDGEILYAYVNFGDHIRNFMAYDGIARISQHYNFPFIMRNTENVQAVITYKGEVYFEDLVTEMDERKAADAALRDEIKSALADFGNSVVTDITIPTSSWEQQDAEAQGYAYYADVAVAAAKETHFPSVALAKESQSIAATARICPSVQANNGTLRFWAKLVPAGEIKATVALLKSETSEGSGGGSYVLPTATKTRLGGVKIGENIDVKPDGTISSVATGKIDPSQFATDDEVQAVLDEVFKE